MKAIRPTKEIQSHGWTNIEIRKGVYGFYAVDTRFTKQRGGAPVRKTAAQVINDILSGNLPINLGETHVANLVSDMVAPETSALVHGTVRHQVSTVAPPHGL